MAYYSPSVSSRTLSHEHIDDEVSVDLESNFDDPPTHHKAILTKDDRAVLPSDEEDALPIIFTRPGFPKGYSPSMLAAAYPDPRILKQVLQNGYNYYLIESPKTHADAPNTSASEHSEHINNEVAAEFGPNTLRFVYGSEVGVTTPLMEAIRWRMPGNVRIILEAGADPNGIPLNEMDRYAAFFLRFRPNVPLLDENPQDVAGREVLLECCDLPQLSQLTMEEIEDRFWDEMAPFWCEEGLTRADFYAHGESMLSLVEAARCGSTEIFEQLYNGGADSSF
jgi:hypothetical protein